MDFNARCFNMLKGTDMKSIHMSEGMLTFNPTKEEKIFRVGDVIQFYPQITIDYYASSNQEEPYMQHVVYDIYKFRFRPIAKYSHDLHKSCYHYLIEIFPDFQLFCFNWTKPYKSYLKLGQWYEGHGQIRNCGNAAEYNEYISPLIMKSIIKAGKISCIYENLLYRDFNKDIRHKMKSFRYSDDVACYEDVLDGFGYAQNLDEFNKNVSKYKEKSVIFKSSDEISAGTSIIFCVNVLR